MMRAFVLVYFLFILVALAGAGIRAASGCVVVSGGTGWVAGHVIEELLKKGYTIHATVRDTSNTKKLQFLLDLEKVGIRLNRYSHTFVILY